MASPQEEEAVKTGVPIENSAHNKTKQDETLPDTDSGSGSETGEKPVREKLKQTDLEEAVHPSATAEVDEDGEVGVETSRDKLNKKRSFEDLEEKDEAEQPSTPSSGVHARKRSRDTRSRQTRKTASLLKHSEVVPEYEEETLEHSGEESERLLDTPQSSGDDSMGSTDNVDSHLKKKRSAEELDAGEHVSLMNKVQATDKMKERRSSPESESRPATQNPSPSNTKNDMGAREVSEPPKVARKRSRDKMEEEDTPNQEQENNQVSTTEATKADSSNSPSDVSKPVAESPITHDADKTTKPPITGGFGNTSAVSPFASTSPKKTQLQTTVNDSPQASASPFAASGFASMSGSTSPFGALGSSSKAKTASPPATELPQTSSSAFSGSGFASMTGTTSPFGSIGTKPSGSVSPLPASSFAATTSQSGFGSLGSKGFGTGLASGFGSGSKLTSFAAPVGDAKLSSGKEAKPFGAPASDSEGHSNDEEDSASDEKATDSKADEESPSETKSFGEPEVEAMKERKFKIRNGIYNHFHYSPCFTLYMWF